MINGFFPASALNIFQVPSMESGLSNFVDEIAKMANELTSLNQKDNEKYRSPNTRAERTDKLDTFWLELPGCKKEDVSVTVDDENVLMVVAKRTVGNRQTTFKTPIVSYKDIENAELTYEDGLLTIKVAPKPQPAPQEPRKLNIK